MLAGERSDEFIELVAHHYANAALAPEADLAWFDDPKERRPSNARRSMCCSPPASLRGEGTSWRGRSKLHERAAELERSVEMRAAVLEALGDDHDAVLHGDAALASYRTAMRGPSGRTRRRRGAWAGLHEGGADDPGESGAFSTSPRAGADR